MPRTEITRTPVDAWVAGKLGVELSALSQQRLEAWQLEAFRETLRYAQVHSRFYRHHMHGVEPDSLTTMEGIRALPFTTENDLIDNEWQFQCVHPSAVSRITTVPTTGTTGKRKRISFTDADQQCAREFIFTGFLTMCRPGDRMLVMMSGGAEGSIGDSVEKAMHCLDITTEVHGAVTDIADAYRHIMEFRPNVLVAIPWQAAALARYGQRFGNPEHRFLRSVLLSADDVPDAVCERLSRLWDCHVFRHYGMTEMCIAGGVECLGSDGYHLRACDLLFEIVDTDAEGYGEIVLTTLHREAMPLLRYRTGDIGRFTDRPCPCGSPLRRIERIRGRRQNSVTLEGKTLFLSDVSNAVFRLPEAVDYECEVQRDGTLRLTIGVLPGEQADVSALDLPATVQQREIRAFASIYNAKKRMKFL